MDALRDIPLTDIDPHALARDRVHADKEALHELQRSIAANDLRQPIEGPNPFGLITGFRKFAALRALNAVADGFGIVAAFVRAPQSALGAYAAMVEENQARVDLSAFERGQIALIAHDRGLFGSVEAPVNGLHAAASKARRSRLRAAAQVADELVDVLVHTQALRMARVLHLSAALRQGIGPVLRADLESSDATGATTEWAALLPDLEEAEAEPKALREKPESPNAA